MAGKSKKEKKTNSEEEVGTVTLGHQDGLICVRTEYAIEAIQVQNWSSMDIKLASMRQVSPPDIRVISVRTKGQKTPDEAHPVQLGSGFYNSHVIVDTSGLYTRIIYDLDLYPGEPYYKVSLMRILDASFKGLAVYDVHACLRECMVEVFGSDSISGVEQIIQSKCRIDFCDSNDLWKEIFLLFDRKSYAIVSEIPTDAPCI
jgi:hypothetical protein